MPRKDRPTKRSDMPERQSVFTDVMETFGFERISITGRNRQQDRWVWWREVDQSGRHIIVSTTGASTYALPDFKTRHVMVTVYRGPDLQHGQERKTTVKDLEALSLCLTKYFEESSVASRSSHHHRY